MDRNKVRFGLENLHIGTYTVADNGTVTLGTPYHQKGAVNLSMDPETAESTFWADNRKYYVENADNGYTGELETAKFDDQFLTNFMNYVALEGGGVAEVKTKKNATVYIIFEVKGDVQARRTILYNVELGHITANPATTEDTKEPNTETLPVTIIGDNGTGVVKASYEKGDAAYDTLFTAPPVPAVPAES